MTPLSMPFQRLCKAWWRLGSAWNCVKIWKIGGNPWKCFGRLVIGAADTCLVKPHPPTRLDFLLHHPSHARLPTRGVGTTGGRGAASINPEENQDNPEDITSRLDDLSGHAPSSRLDLGSGQGGAVTPLSGTYVPDTTSRTS